MKYSTKGNLKKFFKVGFLLLLVGGVIFGVKLVQQNQENRSQAATNDSKCTNNGGKCIKLSSGVKQGTYCNANTGSVDKSNPTGKVTFGLCSGDSSNRCCKPFDDLGCERLKGKCLNNVSSSVKEGDKCNYDNNTDGVYVFGECDGGSDRRCCKSVTSNNPPPVSSSGDLSARLVVATFNIGHAGKTKKANFGSIASKIKENGFDIVGLQEADSGSSLTQKIAESSGLTNYFHTSTSAGNSILSNKGLNSTDYVRLTNCGRDSFRAVQKAVLRVNNKNVSFYNVHIDPDSGSNGGCRKTQVKDVINVIKNDSNPWILVGDFNFGLSGCSEAYNLFNDYSIVAYDEANSGTKCTDLIIISKGRGINVASTKTIKTRSLLSDHNLVSATLEIN